MEPHYYQSSASTWTYLPYDMNIKPLVKTYIDRDKEKEVFPLTFQYEQQYWRKSRRKEERWKENEFNYEIMTALTTSTWRKLKEIESFSMLTAIKKCAGHEMISPFILANNTTCLTIPLPTGHPEIN